MMPFCKVSNAYIWIYQDLYVEYIFNYAAQLLGADVKILHQY